MEGLLLCTLHTGLMIIFGVQGYYGGHRKGYLVLMILMILHLVKDTLFYLEVILSRCIDNGWWQEQWTKRSTS
jgi:hypothetical protein